MQKTGYTAIKHYKQKVPVWALCVDLGTEKAAWTN